MQLDTSDSRLGRPRWFESRPGQCGWGGATENARPENDRVENDGQIPKELQGLENAGLENDVPC